MSFFSGLAFAAGGNGRRRTLALLCLLALGAAGAGWFQRFAPPPDGAVSVGPEAAAERYVLPISAPLDQGDTDLCWVFAAVSMLETDYMSRHPGAHVEFSRADLQRDAIADRFRRILSGQGGEPREGGLSVEALGLIAENGLLDRADFHEIVDIDPVVESLEQALARPNGPDVKARALDDALTASLGAKPANTHLEGRTLSPAALARAALDGRVWTEYDLARDGVEGWGPSRDPDARPETRVRYVKLPTLIDLIHKSLKHGEAAVAGTPDHAFLIFGADYDGFGRPLGYLVKDSLAPYVYRLDAEALNAKLNDVTVAVESATVGLTDPQGPEAATRRRL